MQGSFIQGVKTTLSKVPFFGKKIVPPTDDLATNWKSLSWFKRLKQSPSEKLYTEVADDLAAKGQGGAAQVLKDRIQDIKSDRMISLFPGSPTGRLALGAGVLGVGYGVPKYLGRDINTGNTYRHTLQTLPNGTVMGMNTPYEGNKALGMYAKNFIPIGSRNPNDQTLANLYLQQKAKVGWVDEALAQSGRPIYISHDQDKVFQHALNQRGQNAAIRYATANSRMQRRMEDLGLSPGAALDPTAYPYNYK